MPQGQEPLCLIHFWRIPFSHFLPLQLPPFLSSQCKERVHYGRVGKKVGKFWNKISLTGCKWSSWNALESGSPVSHPFLSSFTPKFSSSALAAAIRRSLSCCSLSRVRAFAISTPSSPSKWEPPVWRSGREGGNILEQNQLKRVQMVQFECPKQRNPCVSSTFEWIPFSHIKPLLLPFFLSLG